MLSALSAKGYTVIAEPICEIWGQYLPRLYEDTNRWGFCFQLEVMDWYRQLNLHQCQQQTTNQYKCSSIPHISQLITDEIKHKTFSTIAKENIQIQKRFLPDIESNEKQNSDIPNAMISTLTISSKLTKNTFEQKDIESEEECNDTFDSNSRIVQKHSTIIIERSALSSLKIFALNLLQNGNISEWEYSLLHRLYCSIGWQPKYILYLRCEASICIERIKMRNRNGENEVDIEFIQSLHKRHELLLNHNIIGDDGQKQSLLENRTIIIIDGSQDKCGVLQQVLSKVEELEEKLSNNNFS